MKYETTTPATKRLTYFLVLSCGSIIAVPSAPAAQPAAAVITGNGVAAPDAPETHEEISGERLQRIEPAIRTYIDDDRVAGAVALVLRDGRVVYELAIGWSDKEERKSMRTDTIFRIASLTKPLTSAAALILVEEGKLGLSEPVSRFIPEFASTSVAVQIGGKTKFESAKRPITIRDLLTHTAGMSYGTQDHIAAAYAAKGLGPAAGLGWYLADKNESVCETMAKLASLPFVSHPGETYVYGYSTDVLGCVIERASGLTLDEFARTRITAPLGMDDTQFFLPSDQHQRLAVAYVSGADGRLVRAPEGAKGQGDYAEAPRKNLSGGAGLLSTAHDYACFLEMIRRGGEFNGKRILSPRAVALMTTNQVGHLYPTEGLGQGFGFTIVERYGAEGMAAPGTFGGGGAYGLIYRVDPQSRVTMILMTQLIQNKTGLLEKFPTLVYQALLEPVGPSPRE